MQTINEVLYIYVTEKANTEGIRIPLQENQFRKAVTEYIENNGLSDLEKPSSNLQKWQDCFDFYFYGMDAKEIVETIAYADLLTKLCAHSGALFVLARQKLMGEQADLSASAKKHYDMIRDIAQKLYNKVAIEEEISECCLDYRYITADTGRRGEAVSFRLGREIEAQLTKRCIS